MATCENKPEYGLEAHFTLKPILPRDCPRCGVTNPPGSSVCDCGYNFATAAAPAGVTTLLVGAGFWIRALARLIDTFVGLIMGFFSGTAGAIVMMILQTLAFVHPGWPLRVMHQRFVIFPFRLVGFILYFTVCEGFYGASLGKFFCGLRVLSEDRSPCQVGAAFIRTISYFIDAFFFGLVGYFIMSQTPAQQRYGDHWAHTVVVKNAEVPAEPKSSEFRFLSAIALGLCAWGIMGIAGVVAAGW